MQLHIYTHMFFSLSCASILRIPAACGPGRSNHMFCGGRDLHRAEASRAQIRLAPGRKISQPWAQFDDFFCDWPSN